jgi:hypothetical protein
MKKFNLFYFVATVFVAFMLILASCTKEGPAGPAGKDGTDGVDGVNGVDGQDGTASCVQCHDADASLVAPEFQWARSMHNAGTALARSSSSSCSQCHSNQGFHLSNGNALGEGVPVNDPTTINCYTCHNIHKDYAASDLEFTFSDEPEWHVTYGKTVSNDLGKGNLCSHCHQSRERDPVVDMGDLSMMYAGISTHYGPHYSSQANLIGGFGAYEIEGSLNYGDGTSTHGKGATDGCVSCHMGFSSASGSGGHGMGVDASSDLEQSCKQCHSDGSGAEGLYASYYKDNFETIDHSVDPPVLNTSSRCVMLGDLLAEKGVYTKVVDSVNGHPDAVHYNINGGLEINGTLTAALFNHRYLYQDHSHGIHNPAYARALLQNSYEAVLALD